MNKLLTVLLATAFAASTAFAADAPKAADKACAWFPALTAFMTLLPLRPPTLRRPRRRARSTARRRLPLRPLKPSNR